MAWTARKGDDIKEYFDNEAELEKKVMKLAELVKASKHFITFTGAGISTSTGIRDYRGPTGVWTMAAEGKSYNGVEVSTLRAVPSSTHMSLVALQKANILKFIISQNCDGLHRRSGIDPSKMSELHGNSNLERCSKCGKEYLRDYDATADYAHSVHDHRTGRTCAVSGCGANLHDSIINFGENLPEVELKNGFDNSEKADLCLVLGSSLTVRPACSMPKTVGKRGKDLVIVNLQTTPLDDLASLRIFARCDVVMVMLMKKLNIPIPPFVLYRRLVLTKTIDPATKALTSVHLRGVDSDNTPFDFIKRAKLQTTDGTDLATSDKEPHEFTLAKPCKAVTAKLYFRKHYGEARLPLSIDNSVLKGTSQSSLMSLDWTPSTGEWKVQTLDANYSPASGATGAEKPKKKKKTKTDASPPKPEATSTAPTAEDSDEDVAEPNPTDRSTYFTVCPKFDCPHVDKYLNIGVEDQVVFDAFKSHNKCVDCSDGAENWLCLSCYKVFCSRYKNGHMAKHNEAQTKHCLALSFSDNSVWCYQCDSYITHEALLPKLNALHKAKFNVKHPASQK